MPRNDDVLCFSLWRRTLTEEETSSSSAMTAWSMVSVMLTRQGMRRELFVYWNRMASASGARRVSCVRVVNLDEREAFHRVMNEEKIYSAIVLSGSKEGT